MTHSIKTRLKAAALGVGALVALTGAAQADQVINDDLIVTGSLCVGFDCVNGESFGFDTIRLKENNTRIKFQDTSTTASFPTNDWQLTANDSANGGANKFSIDDIDNGRTPFTLTAAARSNSIFVNSNGNVGFGTATPAVTLHARSGNTPTLRLEQDGSSGFAPQTWDVAGNETNFFVRDATNGSQLPLRIRPSAPSNSIFVQNNGNVGMGTASPGNELHILRGSGNIGILLESTAGSDQVRLSLNEGTDEFRIVFPNGGGQVFDLSDTGTLTLGGDLITGGAGNCAAPNPPCDAVFDPEVYTVPSIEEHAAAMWENKFLPAVGPTGQGDKINMTVKMLRMLNELEHAHIFIDRLNKRVVALEAQLDDDLMPEAD